MIQAIENNNSDMFYCGYTHLYIGGLRRRFSYPYFSGRILLEVINGSTKIHIGAMLVKRELVDQLGVRFTQGCLVGQDQEFIWNIVSKAKVHAFYGLKRATEYILKNKPADCDEQRLIHLLRKRVAYKL